jgi:MraZ protein
VEEEKQDVGLPLLGTEQATMDEKGRVLIGTKLRKRLGPEFAMALGESGSINAYPKSEWAILVRDVTCRDPRDEWRQKYCRQFFGNAADDLDFDVQGRVVIPRKLRELACIEDKVTIIGMGDHIEIWSKPVYDHLIKNASSQSDALTGMRKFSNFKPDQEKYAFLPSRGIES